MKKRSRFHITSFRVAWPLLVLLPMVQLFLISTRAAEESPTAGSGTTAMKDNPLFSESTLPFRMPRFDEIKNEHFKPAYEEGMEEELNEVEAIASNPEKP